jgi:uncharacterized protein YdhG (YjbR/CyaY superfamily)
MIKRSKVAKSVDEYIELQPENIRENLTKLRKLVRKLAPNAEESISYMMPAYKLNGVLVYFGGFRDHISLFPTASAAVKEKFKKELKEYKIAKGTIEFPLDKPLPFGLIEKIVKFRVEENLKKGNNKKYK